MGIKNCFLQIKSQLFKLFIKTAPIKKHKIIFNNFCGKGYGDNLKYIAEEILNRSRDYDLVWMVNDLNEQFPNGIRPVLYHSRRAHYELATSKIIISSMPSVI